MTFNEMVLEVAESLNLTSDTAMVRIGRNLNMRYKWVTAAIGLEASRQLTSDLEIDPTDPFSELPDFVVWDIEKVIRVQLLLDAGPRPKTLTEVTHTEITTTQPVSGNPTAWAVKRMGSGNVTITFDAFPATDPFTIRVEGYELAQTLEDDAVPAFPTDFHDILVEGAKSEELRKMEKADLAQLAESRYEQRLSDLRMFIAKSAGLDIYQNKITRPWQRPWGWRGWQ